MAMNIPAGDGGSDEVVSAINTTPLVDVMLVLLIIFLITIPVVTTSVAVELPKKRNQVRETKAEDIVISVDARGGIFWFDSRIEGTQALTERLKTVAKADPQPEVHIRGDAHSAYAPVGKVLHACQRAGILKVGFITEPPPKG